MPETPEQQARKLIDNQLEVTGWQVQDYAEMNLHAGQGVAVREFPLTTGYADYLLLGDGKAIGVVEAKEMGTTLSGIHHQSQKYSQGLPDLPQAWCKPLPFLYESTGVETQFTSELDPEPRNRRVFTFHQPETLVGWVSRATSAQLDLPALSVVQEERQPYHVTSHADTLRARLRCLPSPFTEGLWPPQVEAITNLEKSLAANRPRALIQMATGSGKTFVAVNTIYRLLKFADARRVLFLVDRNNLGNQAKGEFDKFVTPDDGRKFTELYNVYHLRSNALDHVSRVWITTIQRLFSMLKGEPEFDPDLEAQSMDELDQTRVFGSTPKEIAYSPTMPVEFFDFIFVDECHRSIYNLWRQVLEYFDAYLIGLTATPSKQTLGFFNQNLVMEYGRQRAVADGINVDNATYQIRTRITGEGSTIDADYVVEKRDRETRDQRWERLDEDFTYVAPQLDREVVSESQIRTIVRTFRDKLFTHIFPGRTDVPKTLIFAKDDAHAEEIVRIVREEFGKGNEFCQKITYKVTGVSTDSLIATFRNSYYPRVAVTVDMIATGTDIKPVEIVFFMRLVKSAGLFEQMLGRGTRVINPTDLQAVTPDAQVKDHFVIVDAVGAVEHPKLDTQSLERKPSTSFKKLLDNVAMGADDEDTLSTLAGRLARLGRKLDPEDEAEIETASGGISLQQLANTVLDAVDPDQHLAAAQEATGCDTPLPAQVAQAAQRMMSEAARLFAANPKLRLALLEIHTRSFVVIDDISQDEVLVAEYSQEATEQARATVESFRQFIQDNKDEITALQIIYNQPYSQQRLTLEYIKELRQQILRYRPAWTTEALWNAYQQMEKGQARGTTGQRPLTDLISLVRCVVQVEDELVPYPDLVQRRYQEWLRAQEAGGRQFTPEQRHWLDEIAVHVGVDLSVTLDDLNEYFYDEGGILAARRVFGEALPHLLEDLNEVLVM